ncbi:hypothetical protein D3C78_651830 [compost metagenome]
MSQHVIANQLAFAQTAAVANHQPHVRAQDGEVVTDGFSIRRADANVDERNALAIGGNQMPGGHLVFFPGQVGDGHFRRFSFGGDPDPPRARECHVRAIGIEDLAATPAHELIHVAGVVGEQHERLEMFGWRPGVVTQARQREVDAAGIEMRQRRKFSRMINSIGGFIANLRQLGGGEMAG